MNTLHVAALGTLVAILASGAAFAAPGAGGATAGRSFAAGATVGRSFPAAQSMRPIAPAASVDRVKRKRWTPQYVRFARQLQSCGTVDPLFYGAFLGLRAYSGRLANCWPYAPDWLDPYWL